MQVVTTTVPTMPQGPFSQAVKHDGIVYVSGQVPYDGTARQPVLGDIKVQARQALRNLESVLNSSGSSLDKVIKLTCILPNFPHDYVGFNEVYHEFFRGPSYPARTTIQAGLLGGFLIEIEAIAVCT